MKISNNLDPRGGVFMLRIRCVVERITYQNPDNGYSVLKVAVKGYDDLVTVVGNLLDASVGSVLLIEGNWKVDAKYGRQFCAETWEEVMPATIYGIEKYLGSGLIKGVGPQFAKRIVAKFGTDTISVIEDTPDRLLEVYGIGKKRVDKIKESWEKQKEIKNIMLFLQSNGVSTAFAAKIYKTYGNESIDKVKENPFRLADDIWGIGFKTADSIAEKLGFGKCDYVRCRSGIMYTLNALADEGHVYVENTIADTEDGVDKLNEAMEGGTEEQTMFEKLSDLFQTAINDMSNLMTHFQNTIRKCMNSIAILILTNCLMPIVNFFILKWILKETFHIRRLIDVCKELPSYYLITIVTKGLIFTILLGYLNSLLYRRFQNRRWHCLTRKCGSHRIINYRIVFRHRPHRLPVSYR